MAFLYLFVMVKLIFLFIFAKRIFSDTIDNVDYVKIPAEGPYDIGFTFNADAGRQCVVALSRNGVIVESAKCNVASGSGQYRAVSLGTRDSSRAAGAGYSIEISLRNDADEVVKKFVPVTVENGRQGFYTVAEKVYDANKNVFIIRGINNAHADWDNYDRWYAYMALDGISYTKANTVRILWRKDTQQITISALDKIITRTIELKMIPMVELHDATGSNDPVKLLEMAYWWADHTWLLMKYRMHIMLNIANEWSEWGTPEQKWHDTYSKAINIIRNAGFSGLIVVDGSAYAQNPYGPIWYGHDLIYGEPYRNLLFGIHTYAEWSKEIPNYTLGKELKSLYDLKIPVVIGEFASLHPAKLNGQCINATIDAVAIMSDCEKYGYGYLGWSWCGNGHDECGSLSYLDIAKNSDWNAIGEYSSWGEILVNTPRVGLQDSSKIASLFK